MRLQSSIEFIIILSAVAGLASVAITMYMHVAASQNQAINSISALSRENITFSAGAAEVVPHISLELPKFSFINRTNVGYLILMLPKGAMAASISINSIDAEISPGSFNNVTVFGLGLLNISFIPKTAGSVDVAANALIISGNGSIISAISSISYTDAVSPNSNRTANQTGQELQGSIIRYSESAIYPFSAFKPIGAYGVWLHCPYRSWFWGWILSEPQQCGANTWGFVINGGCDQQDANGWDMYMCVKEVPSAVSASTVSQRFSRNYSIHVSIYNSTLKLSSNLSSNDNSSALADANGGYFGNSVVQYVSGYGYLPDPGSMIAVLNKSGSFYQINKTYYSNYTGIAATLIQDMSAYNRSRISDSTLQMIKSLINSTNNEWSLLVNATPVESAGCAISITNGLAYVCNPFSQFSYGIDIAPSNTFMVKNQTIDIGSSSIQIR
jgi:hypothetical protein